MKAKIFLTYIILSSTIAAFAQNTEDTYQRELSGISETWHKIVLPDEMYGNISTDFSDIRILGITDKNDTIEAPYFLNIINEELVQNEVEFSLINKVKNDSGYFYTFELRQSIIIDQIFLDFKRQNFDWLINIEGSQNQKEWYTITQDYRILSIKNSITDYSFTKIKIPQSRYRYFRLFVKTKRKPRLNTATISTIDVKEGSYKNDTIETTIIENKSKQTIIEMELSKPIPVSYIKFYINNSFDYYRPFTIKYLSDSTQTPKGWNYHYNTIASGTLSSLEENEVKFFNTITRKLKIIIDNYDNEPLSFGDFEVKGNIHELIVRFTHDAKYFIFYGDKFLTKPNYDIHKFRYKIPETLTELSVGDETIVIHEPKMDVISFFFNTTWLWIIMSVIIVVLAWFSIRMMGKKE